MSVDDLRLTDRELEAVVRHLDKTAAPESYTTTDGPPLATGHTKLKRELTARMFEGASADVAGEDAGLAEQSSAD